MTLYKHDCEACVSLGAYRGHDLYYCNGSLVARYGDDGPEYTSWPADVPRYTKSDELEVARDKAIERGLIKRTAP